MRLLLASPTVLGPVALASAALAGEPWQDAIATGCDSAGVALHLAGAV
jgi:hypothetical protein